MKSQSPLVKYHFWLLLGFVPLLIMIGAVMVSSNVGDEVAARQKELDDAKSKIASKTNPKSTTEIEWAAKLAEKIGGKQGGLHQANWDRQKYLFTWPYNAKGLEPPESKLLKDIEYGEANIERAADKIIEAKVVTSNPKAMKAEEKATKIAAAKADYEKLPAEKRVAALQAQLDEVTLLVPPQVRDAYRKSLLEPAWPKFGDAFPTTEGQLDVFKKAYQSQFSTIAKDGSGAPGTGMADRIAPTQFRGGWRSQLRHVNDFGTIQLNKDQVWLMLEDIWIQRSLLDAVRSINEELAAFRRVKLDQNFNATIDRSYDELGNKIMVDAKGNSLVDRSGNYIPDKNGTPENEKLKGTFASRTWAVELEIASDGGQQRLTGKLINLTDRLQLMGVGNIMTLHVWFKNSTQPMVFKVQGEYVPGKGAKKLTKNAAGKEEEVPDNVRDIVPLEDHGLPPSGERKYELARVEQVFDIRTVPVKRIDAMALGFLDSRSVAEEKKLLPPSSPPFAEVKEPDLATGPEGLPGGAPGLGAPGAGAPGVGAPMPPADVPPMGFEKGFPGQLGKGAAVAVRRGGGPLAAVVDGNKKRYTEVTPQFRRMSVGIVVVIDQTQIQDMLMAFANSPLRFQITQVEWTRFHGKLDGTSASANQMSDNEPELRYGRVDIPGSIDPGFPPPFVPQPPAFPKGPFPSPFPGMGPGFGPGRQGPTVSDSQITSGLVELSIYGVVSLYEKYDPNAPAAGASPGTPGSVPGGPANTPGPMPGGPANTPGPMPRRRRK